MYYVGFCENCGQGLLGIRICCNGQEPLIVCDECDAVWLTPDCLGTPLLPGQPHSTCPLCGQPLWEPAAHWASQEEIARLGWQAHVAGHVASE